MKASDILKYFEDNPKGQLIDDESVVFKLDDSGNVTDNYGSKLYMNVHIEADLTAKKEE